MPNFAKGFPTEEHFAESQKKSPFIHEKTIRKQLSTNRQPLPAQEVTAQSDMDSGMIYGTAWKEDDTSVYVKQALGAGFRAIDVAAQPKHYREDLVGEGIRAALKDGYVKREDIYVRLFYSWLLTRLRKCTCNLHHVYNVDSNQIQLSNGPRGRDAS